MSMTNIANKWFNSIEDPDAFLEELVVVNDQSLITSPLLEDFCKTNTTQKGLFGMPIIVNKEGYLLSNEGVPGSLIILSDKIKDAFGSKDTVELVLINGTFVPVIKQTESNGVLIC